MSEYYNPEVQQQYPDTCAIKSQQLVLEDFGIDVSETQLVQTANANGWYNGGGTNPQDVGNLLNLAGIPVTKQDGNVFTLVNELAQGHKVIVGVDADELWHNDSVNEKWTNWVNDFFGSQGGNHALIVAGIDTSDPNNVRVIVKDPGSGDDGKPYPLEQFMDAWADTQCYMVSTNISAPEYANGMKNFDYELGHLHNVAGVSYPDFQIFNDISMGLPEQVTNIDGNPISPIPSLTDAFFDYSANEIDFSQIFTDNYIFNDYLDCDNINSSMQITSHNGLENIDWNNIQPMDSIGVGGFNPTMLSEMNVDYNTFFNDCINQFSAIGDVDSMELCQQQLNIMDYCECNDIDYSANFLMC